MVTNKAFTIRLGQTQPWTSTHLAQNWYQYHLNLKLKAFFEKFFGDKFFQNRGVSFSHVLPRFFNSHVNLEVFLHDSKLYDFFSTKPARRALKIFKSRKKLKPLFKKICKFKKYFKRLQSGPLGRKLKRFKRGKQSRFSVSTGSPRSFRRRFSSPFFLTSRVFSRVSTQTLESKFKKNRYFRLKYKNVRKFVRVSRKLKKRFFKGKLKFFKTVKLKKSNRSFTNSKYNFILNRRKYLSSIFMTRRRFKRRKFKKKFFKKNFFRYRRNFRFRRIFFKKKQLRKKKKNARLFVKKKYSRQLIKITRKFSSRFSSKLKRIKINFLRFYLKNSKNLAIEPNKFASYLKAYYFRKKYAVFNNLRNKKILNSKRLRKSKLGRKFFRLYSFSRKSKNNLKSVFFKKKSHTLKKYPFRAKFKYKLPRRNAKFNFKKNPRIFRYPHWRVRYLPITERGKKATRFVFFNPLSAYASNRFIRYSFYHFLAKFLSAQVFKEFKIPVFIKFNFFPLHRAGSDFYLNFITTKLYYRYILSDVIKPIVRISLKFYRGFVINCNGRFTRAQIAVSKKFLRKSVSYSKITSSLDYAQRSVILKYGTCNLRIWIRK